MKNNYSNLIAATFFFSQRLSLGREEALNCLKISINAGNINVSDLKIELEDAISDENFDWKELATKNELLIEINEYTNEEVKEYVRSLIQEYLK